MLGPHCVLVPIVSRTAVATARTATLRAEEFGRCNIRVRVARPNTNRVPENKDRKPQPVRADVPRICSPVPTARECRSRGAFKNGAGTASSPRIVSNTAIYEDEPSPPPSPRLLAHFLKLNAEPDAADFFVIAPSEPWCYPTTTNSSRLCHAF